MIERLSKGSVSRIAKAAKAGLYPDGGGLYVQIARGGTASWIAQYKFRKRRRKMGLGALRLVDLDQARAKNTEAQRLLRVDGIDPLALRAKRRATPWRAACGRSRRPRPTSSTGCR